MTCYINGVIHTMLHEKEMYHQLSVENGIIVNVGDALDLSSCDQIIDLKGAHLYPGFVDAHLHLLGYGEHLATPNLSACTNKQMVFQHLDQFRGSAYLFAQGYLDQGITAEELEIRYPGQIMLLRHNDFHGLTLSKAALNHFHVSDDTGILKELKAQHVLDLIPKKTKQSLMMMLEKAMDSLYQYGITGGHSDDLFYYNGFDETYAVFEDVMKKKPFRTHLLMHHEVIDDYIKSKKLWGIQSPYLELGAVKMFYDGTMSSQTALMKDPYKTTKDHGEVVMGKDHFTEVLLKARSYGLPVAVHVIGDLGLDEVVDLLHTYPPKEGLMDRIIHAPWMMHETLAKMKGRPMTFDIQPPFLASDLPRAYQLFSKAPDAHFPWKTYLNHQLILSGSSDAPVENPNPLLGIRDAIFRRSRVDHQVYQKEEALSAFEAIKLYTTTAHAQSLITPRGYIKKGYLADFTVLDQAIEHMEEEAFSKPHVVMTIIDNKIVYRRD